MDELQLACKNAQDEFTHGPMDNYFTWRIAGNLLYVSLFSHGLLHLAGKSIVIVFSPLINPY